MLVSLSIVSSLLANYIRVKLISVYHVQPVQHRYCYRYKLLLIGTYIFVLEIENYTNEDGNQV